MQSCNILEILVYSLVQCSLAHLLQLLLVLFCQGIDKGTIGVEEDGVLVVVVVDLFLEAPPPEEPEPAGHVGQVPALVHTVLPHVVEELLVLFIDKRFVFLWCFLSCCRRVLFGIIRK